VVYNSIVLLGFRGTGKSSVGKILAEKLDWQFVELDKLIEQNQGQTIAQLTNNGTTWDNFREIESQLLTNCLKKERQIISCGGGVGVNDQNGNLQKQILDSSFDCLKILLTADTEVVKERLLKDFKNKNDSHRVSLQGEKESEESFWQNNQQILNKRKALYEVLSKNQFDTSTDSISTITDKIITQFKNELLS
jgi:shikimate kinase